jgi:hypothetical protein
VLTWKRLLAILQAGPGYSLATCLSEAIDAWTSQAGGIKMVEIASSGASGHRL